MSYTCSICNYSTESKGNINKHIKIKETCKEALIIENINEEECNICNKKFKTKILLKNHKISCVEKKTILVNKFQNEEEFREGLEFLKKIVMGCHADIKLLVEKNKVLEKENDKLVKRLEKLEKSNKEGYDEIEYDEDILCEHNDDESYTPITREQIYEKNPSWGLVSLKKIEVVEVLLKNESRTGYVEARGIKIDNILYAYDPKERRPGEKLASSLKIVCNIECENKACYQIKKDGKKYCDKHIHLN